MITGRETQGKDSAPTREARSGSTPTSSSVVNRASPAFLSAGYAVQRQMLAPGQAPSGYDQQIAALRPGGPSGGNAATTIAQAGMAGGGQRLPHFDRVQASFGAHDVSGVQAHVGGPARSAAGQLGASAYAMGSSVAFAGPPDLRTAAHEAAHVVQQRAGVSLSSNLGSKGDAYEVHADRVADAVVAGRSAEPLLAQGPGGGGSASAAVQCYGGGEADLGPTPEPSCEARPSAAPLLQQLEDARSAIPGQIDGVRSTATSALGDIAQALQGISADMVRWTEGERAIMTRAYAEFLASQGGASYAGDALGVASTLNIFNPDPISKLVIGCVVITAGFALRIHNRNQARAQQAMRQQFLAANEARSGGLSEVSERGVAEMLNAFLNGTAPVTDLAWTGGYLEALSGWMETMGALLDAECREDQPRETALDRNQGHTQRVLGLYRGVSAHLTEELRRVPTLAREVRSQGRTAYENAREAYIAWLATAGPIRVNGAVTWDEQSGGSSLSVTLDTLTGIGGTDASLMSQITKNEVLWGPGDLLNRGSTFRLTADTTVHAYEVAPGSGPGDLPAGVSDERGAPVTFNDVVTYTIARDGASGEGYLMRWVPVDRIRAELLERSGS